MPRNLHELYTKMHSFSIARQATSRPDEMYAAELAEQRLANIMMLEQSDINVTGEKLHAMQDLVTAYERAGLGQESGSQWDETNRTGQAVNNLAKRFIEQLEGAVKDNLGIKVGQALAQ